MPKDDGRMCDPDGLWSLMLGLSLLGFVITGGAIFAVVWSNL